MVRGPNISPAAAGCVWQRWGRDKHWATDTGSESGVRELQGPVALTFLPRRSQ